MGCFFVACQCNSARPGTGRQIIAKIKRTVPARMTLTPFWTRFKTSGSDTSGVTEEGVLFRMRCAVLRFRGLVHWYVQQLQLSVAILRSSSPMTKLRKVLRFAQDDRGLGVGVVYNRVFPSLAEIRGNSFLTTRIH